MKASWQREGIRREAQFATRAAVPGSCDDTGTQGCEQHYGGSHSLVVSSSHVCPSGNAARRLIIERRRLGAPGKKM
jgi:hypothetical protein